MIVSDGVHLENYKLTFRSTWSSRSSRRLQRVKGRYLVTYVVVATVAFFYVNCSSLLLDVDVDAAADDDVVVLTVQGESTHEKEIRFVNNVARISSCDLNFKLEWRTIEYWTWMKEMKKRLIAALRIRYIFTCLNTFVRALLWKLCTLTEMFYHDDTVTSARNANLSCLSISDWRLKIVHKFSCRFYTLKR